MMWSRIRACLALAAGGCLAIGPGAQASDDATTRGVVENMSSLDSLAQLVAPDLSRIATENQATPSDIAKYGAFALVFCPTHQRFEATSVYSAGIKERFFARTDPTALNDDPLRLGN